MPGIQGAGISNVRRGIPRYTEVPRIHQRRNRIRSRAALPGECVMTGEHMQLVRASLDLNRVQFGRAIGYDGDRNTIDQTIRRYENGDRDIPGWIATAVRAMDHDGMLEFIRSCMHIGVVDQVQFVRMLSGYLTGQ